MTTGVLRFGPFVLDAADARLRDGARDIELTPKAFAVLCHLASHPARLVTKDELLDAVWGRRFVSESVLKTAINAIRDALDDDARQPRYVETAPRRGYRFIAPVSGAATQDAMPVQPLPQAQPPRSHADGAGVRIQRTAALAALCQRWAAVVSGAAAITWVAGEAGIGKSTLIDEFSQQVALGGGALVGHGQCVEHLGGVEPYLPVLEALDTLCAAPVLLPLMRQVAPTWLVQLPWHLTADDRLQLQREVTGTTQERMLREFGELMRRLSEQQPVLLVLEDLHWSDAATVQLLGYLARRRGAARWMLLGSFRPAELIVSDHPLKALCQALKLQRLCEEIDLEAFSEVETAAYLAQRCGGAAPPDAFVRALHHLTGGVPLFVAAVVDELLARHAGAAALPWLTPDGAVPTLSVPRSLFGVLEQQWQRLPQATQHALGAACVAGVEFSHSVVADVLRSEADAIQALFDALVGQRAWLRDAGVRVLPGGRVSVRYAFRHAVYRQALYDMLPPATRIRWHRALAETLQSAAHAPSESADAELALHCERGQDAPAAARHWLRAARVALQRFAAREAAAIAQRALQSFHTMPDRHAMRVTEFELCALEGVALAQARGIASPDTGAAFERAAELLEHARHSAARLPALQGLWWVAIARGEVARAQAMAERVAALGERDGDAALAFAGQAALGLTAVHTGEVDLACGHLSGALQRLRTLDVAVPDGLYAYEPAVHLGSYLALALWWRGRPSLAAERARDTLVLAEQLRQPMSWLLVWSVHAMLHLCAAEFEAARAACERGLELARTHRLERGAGPLAWMRGRSLAGLGDSAAGLEQMRQGHAVLTQAGLRYNLTWWHQAYADACLEAGQRDAARAAIAEGLALADQTGELAMVPELLRLRARMAADDGDRAAAQQALHDAVTLARRQGALVHEIAATLQQHHLVPGEAALHTLRAALARWSDAIEPPAVAQARAMCGR